MKILPEEYVAKVDIFLDLWRQQMISDIELVESITNLGKEVVIIDNNFAIIPAIQIKPKD